MTLSVLHLKGIYPVYSKGTVQRLILILMDEFKNDEDLWI